MFDKNLISNKIKRYVNNVSLKVKEDLNDRGQLVYLISSDAGKDLRALHPSYTVGSYFYRKALEEHLQNEFNNGKSLPFEIEK